jgi:hypothetical protein
LIEKRAPAPFGEKALRTEPLGRCGEPLADHDKPTETMAAAQYNRVAYEFRHFDQIIWQIPTVAITITSVMFAVAFNFVHIRLISGVVLLLGSFFDFSLAIALSKHRLMEDVRAWFLKDLETSSGLKVVPVLTVEAEKYLSTKQHKHVSPPWLRRQNAFHYLLWSILFLTISQLIIGIFYLVISIWVI